MQFLKHMMRLLSCFVVLSCLVASDALASPPLKVMSFNIRYDGSPGKPSDEENAWLATSGQHRRDMVFQVLADCDPDILCLQEALKNQIADLQGALPGHAFYGVGRDDGVEKGEYSGIFFRRDRFAKRDEGSFWLNKDPDQPGTKFPKTCCARLASWLILQDKQANNREFLMLNTHWDHQIQDSRLFSAPLIRQRMKALAGNLPYLVAGDLNVRTDNRAFQLLKTATPDNRLELLDSYREMHPQPEKNEGTFHGFRGNTDGPRIDFVLHSQSFRTTSADIVRTHEQLRYPSDHYPVTATLVFVE